MAMSTKHYHIAWYISIDAESPEEAAQEALDIQRDPASTATVFTVDEAEGAVRRSYCLDVDPAYPQPIAMRATRLLLPVDDPRRE